MGEMAEKERKIERILYHENKDDLYADDEITFESEIECREHERKVKQEILQNMKDLDLYLCKKYFPELEINAEPELFQASMWLQTDISEIMVSFPESKDEIISTIKANPYGDKILQDYLNFDKLERNVEIRNDFLAALKSVKRGSELSGPLDWSFSKRDLTELAKLHKANKCRKKIEDLLTDCNFHYESAKFKRKIIQNF